MANETLVYGALALAPRHAVSERRFEVVSGTGPQLSRHADLRASDCPHRRAQSALHAPTAPVFAHMVFLLSVLVVLVCAAPLGLHGAKAHLGAASVPSVQVEVETGDSLWSMARDHPVPGLSTNEVVHLIRTMNKLDSALLTPGMQLTVPELS